MAEHFFHLIVHDITWGNNVPVAIVRNAGNTGRLDVKILVNAAQEVRFLPRAQDCRLGQALQCGLQVFDE